MVVDNRQLMLIDLKLSSKYRATLAGGLDVRVVKLWLSATGVYGGSERASCQCM